MHVLLVQRWYYYTILLLWLWYWSCSLTSTPNLCKIIVNLPFPLYYKQNVNTLVFLLHNNKSTSFYDQLCKNNFSKWSHLLYIHRVAIRSGARISSHSQDPIRCLRWMKRVPEQVLVSVSTRHREREACYLSPVSPYSTTPSIRHTKSCAKQI